MTPPSVDACPAPSELPAPHSVVERVTFSTLRSLAMPIGFAGVALLTATIPMLVLSSADERARAIARTALLLALALIASGALARHLATSRRPLLPSERVVRRSERALGGWLLVLFVALWLVPLSAFYELSPLRSLWADMLAVLRENGFIGAEALRGGQNSGLVLLPVFATMVVPLLEFATATFFAVSSAILVPLLLRRSSRFPRAFAICVLLQAGLVFASVYGAKVAADVSSYVAGEIGRITSHTRTIEDVRMLGAMDRYNTVLASTAQALVWAFAAYAVWLAPLLCSRRARETFALPPFSSPLEEASPVAVAGMSEETRRRFYADAARTLQASGGSDAPLHAVTIVAVIVSVVMGAVFMGFSIFGALGKSGLFTR